MSADGHGSGHDDEVHEEHEEHVNHEAWVIPYADLLTLLMAMFIALFAVSNVDAQKFKELASGFNQALRTGSGNSTTIIDLGGSGDKPFSAELNSLVRNIVEAARDGAKAALEPEGKTAAALTLQQLDRSLHEADTQATTELQKVQQLINEKAVAGGFGDALQTAIDDRGLVITVVTDAVVFRSGSAELGLSGADILQLVGSALATVDNHVLVEGHTDNVPINTATYPSNWELSSARAGAVVRFFERMALLPGRLQAAGFADTRPIDSNTSDSGRARNRRVEVIVASDADALKTRILEEASLASSKLARTDTP